MLWQLEKHFFSRRNQVVCPKKIILDWRQMVKTGAHNYFWDLTGIYSKPATIKLVSAFFFSYGVTAALGFAYALAAVVQRYMPSVLLNQIIEPTIIAKYTENHDFRRSAHYFSIVFKANLLILIPLTCWFYFYGDIVVNLISNGKYHHITWIISWLLVNQMLQSLMGLLQQASNAVQKSELLSECNVRTLLLLLLPAAGLVYFFGLPGLLLSLSATFFHRNIYILQRLYGYGYHFLLDWQGMAKIMTAAVAALTVAAITTLLFENNVIVCFAGLGVGAIVYLGFTFIMKPFSLLERETINKLLGRKLFA
jgi:O-antigen/teichoic acid export membrane protein